MTIESSLPDRLAQRLADSGIEVTTLPDDTAVLLDVPGHRVLTLSITAAFILEQLRSGVLDPEAIVHAMTAEFEVDAATAHADLDRFLADIAGSLLSDRASG